MLRLAEIAAVQKSFVTPDAVICPLPDKRTHHLLLAVDQIPIGGDIAAGIAHGVGVFAHHKGACLFGITQNLLPDHVKGWIHHADHIHQICVIILGIRVLQSLIIDRTGGIPASNVFGAVR